MSIIEKRPAGDLPAELKKKKKKAKKSPEPEPAVAAPVEPAAAAPAEKAEKKKKKNKKSSSDDVPVASETASPTPIPESSPEKSEKKKKKNKLSTEEKLAQASAAASQLSDSKKASGDHASHPFYKEHNIIVTGRPSPKPATSFDESGLPKQISDYCVKKFGKDGKPSLIQAVAWPLIMNGEDVFGIAKTGSGKSLAFVLPYLARRLNEADSSSSKKEKKHYPKLVCMAPTKELVQQIAEVCEEFCKVLSIELNVHCIIGGVPKHEQISKIRGKPCDVVIATPGRLLDLVENDQVLNLSKCEYLILDEADRMLDDGFILSIRKIEEYCGNRDTRQTVLFSATWPMEVNKLARGLIKPGKDVATITVLRKDQTLDDPDNINTEDKLQLNDAISQKIHVLEDGRKKWDLLIEVLNKNPGKKTLIFGLYKIEVAKLESWLRGSGYKVTAIQGDMSQDKRTKAIEDFKNNTVRTLVATDVAARGLDIPDIDLVLNYTFPLTVEDFVHRTGRTGRAGKKGAAITFFNKSGEHKEKEHCFDICRLLEGAKQPVPAELKELSKNTFVATKKKSHGMYGDFFKSAEEMEKLSKKKVQMTFDSSDDEE